MTDPSAGEIKVVSFDADGTLWDFDATMRIALALSIEYLAARDPRLGDLRVDALVDARRKVGVAHAKEVVSMERLRFEGFRAVLDGHGIADDDLARDVTAFYLQARFDDLILFSEVRATLETLRPDYVLALISNGNSDPQRCGLDGVFTHTVFADRFGVAKPDPRIFEELVRQAGCAAGRIVHVGDSIVNDVDGATAAGMQAVWLDRSGNGPNAHASSPVPMIKSLAELPAVLGGMTTHREGHR